MYGSWNGWGLLADKINILYIQIAIIITHCSFIAQFYFKKSIQTEPPNGSYKNICPYRAGFYAWSVAKSADFFLIKYTKY